MGVTFYNTMKEGQHLHLKYQICVSGAAETGHCAPNALETAKAIGAEIARRGAVLLTGATTGFPYWAAIGCKEAGGYSVGISPAQNEEEHVEKYKLPLDYMDVILYTGGGMSLRDMLLTQASDAVIIGCGRMGTLHEFTVAFENHKPIGIVDGAGGTADLLKLVLEKSNRAADNPNVIFEANPKLLLDRLYPLMKPRKVQGL